MKMDISIYVHFFMQILLNIQSNINVEINIDINNINKYEINIFRCSIAHILKLVIMDEYLRGTRGSSKRKYKELDTYLRKCIFNFYREKLRD